MSKNTESNAKNATETEPKKSGRPALQEQSIQVELSDKKVKIVRKTNQSIEIINKGKMITPEESVKLKKAKAKLVALNSGSNRFDKRIAKLDKKKDADKIKELKAAKAAKIKELKEIVIKETVKFKNGEVMKNHAKAVLEQVVIEKNLDINCDRYNTRMLGKNVIEALQAQAS